MSAPTSIENLPRHLQGSTSTSSSSNPSPVGTPPSTSFANVPPPASTAIRNRSPSTSAAPPIPSPGITGAPPPSPGSNRFGLNLGFIQRRPRGWTTSSAQRSPGGRSPATSPNTELPPSPAGERSSGGYGFPALRRTLSKRSNSNAGEGSKPRARRSSSQPPAPIGLNAGASSSGELPSTGSTGASAAVGSSSSHQPTTAGPSSTSTSVPGFPSLTATTSLPNPSAHPSCSTAPSRSGTGETTSADPGPTHKLRLVPHLESSRSLHFDPIERDMACNSIVRVGRFTDRHGGASNVNQGSPSDPARVAFKSKVVSRGHAEIWVDDGGKFHIRDTKSSSGTFLNHIRLSGPNIESRPFSLKDGDVLQLGVDYQGGTEEIYRCVKMRVELNRGWQRGANNFNTAALAQLRALGGGGGAPMEGVPISGTAMTAVPSSANATPKSTLTPAQQAAQAQAAAASITDCCICLYPVTVCQALFIAPCSHVTHFKCIRPLVEQNYPGFCCPLCRTYANLEADVEIDLPELEPEPSVVDEPLSESALGLSLVSREPDMDAVEEVDEPASRAPSIRNATRPGESRRSSVTALTTALNDAARRGSSRPGSIAPSIREREGAEGPSSPGIEEVDGDDEMEEVVDGVAAPVPHISPSSPLPDASAASSPSFPSSSSAAIPLSIGTSSSHLAPPSDEFYASLASAATPPNNTFLSTLADSNAPSFSGNAAAAFFARGAPVRPVAAGPPASGGAGMGSLDAVMAGSEAGPSSSKVSLGSASATTNSGGSDEGEASAEGEGDDADTQEAGSQRGVDGEEEVMPSPTSSAAGRGKGKEKEAVARGGVGSERRTASPSNKAPATQDDPDDALSSAVALLF